MKTLIAAVLAGGVAMASAQTINLWRGGESQADWNDPYKWKLQHAPTGEEAVHFRQPNSVIMINSTIELDNGIMLYGRDLYLEGHGHLNLWSPIPHKRTVSIPASATGQANLILGDTLTLNGRIALAAKAFGTSASKGSVTLKDRSTISGILQVGNNGSGSGQVFIEDQATFRISGLELQTLAAHGGSAEIHILGGTAHLTAEADPFSILLEDSSRKIIIGENGILRIDSDLPAQRKAELVDQLISQRRIIAADGCRFPSPVIQDNKIELTGVLAGAGGYGPPSLAEVETAEAAPAVESLLSSTDEAPEVATADAEALVKRKVSLVSLLQDMRTNSEPDIVADTPVNTRSSEKVPAASADGGSVPLAGYIVFVSAVLFCMRPQHPKK